MHYRQSEQRIVPMKPVNKQVEGRGCHRNRSLKGNTENCTGDNYTGGRGNVSTELERIKHLVEEYPERKLQTIMHCVNENTLKKEHEKQIAGKATGVDRVTKEEYEENLKENLSGLMERMKTFRYHPQPVRRTYITKEGKEEKRPLGIPAYEDKLVQGVMAEILNEIYEPKFYDNSFGFRKGKSCHDAIRYLNDKLMVYANWIVDVDIKGFFNHVDHEWMMKFLEHEIEDKNFLRYIKRFLKAGIMEAGEYIKTEEGVPQGGVCSPIMANIYLHYVVDTWFEIVIKKLCRGKAVMARYADDIVFSFEHEDEAKAFYEALKERLRKFRLELSEEKSKIIPFGPYTGKKSEKFDFLGFTVRSGKSRKGKPMIKFQTSTNRLKVKRKEIKRWIRERMHMPVGETIEKLNRKLQGHYSYYGISHNKRKLNDYYTYARNELYKTLRKRGQKRKLNWERYLRILKYDPLVRPRIAHPLWNYKS